MSFEELAARVRRSPYHSWVGVEPEEIERGRVVLRLDLAEHHLNPQGIVHGGVVAGLLDSVCGLCLRTLLTPDVTHRTIQLTVTYLRAGRTGMIRATGTAVHSGRRTGYAEGEVRDEDGTLMARGTASFVNLPLDGS